MLRAKQLLRTSIICLVLSIGLCASSFAQRPVGRYLLSFSKDGFEAEKWAAETFVSIEPSASHVVASLTFCKQATAGKPPVDERAGGRYTFELPAGEFECLQRLFQYSLTKAQSTAFVSQQEVAVAFFLYVHAAPQYSECRLDDKGQLRCFFTSIREELACEGNGVTAETKEKVLRLLQRQLEFLNMAQD